MWSADANGRMISDGEGEITLDTRSQPCTVRLDGETIYPRAITIRSNGRDTRVWMDFAERVTQYLGDCEVKVMRRPQYGSPPGIASHLTIEILREAVPAPAVAPASGFDAIPHTWKKPGYLLPAVSSVLHPVVNSVWEQRAQEVQRRANERRQASSNPVPSPSPEPTATRHIMPLPDEEEPGS